MNDETENLNQLSDSRRKFLKMISATGGIATLAGCSGGNGGNESGGDSSGSDGNGADGDSSGSEESRHGGTMTFALGGSPRNLSYWQSYDTITNNLTTQIWDGLLEFGEPDMELQPALASDWTAEDETTYVYELREGVMFHDGSEMTAEDVIASAELTRSDEAQSPLAWMFDSVESFTEVDEYTVEVSLSEPDAAFQFVPATTAWCIAPASAIDEMGTDLAQDPIGAGPFQLEEWNSGNYVEVSRHEDYWDEDLPYLDGARFEIVPSGTARITGLQNGDYGGTNDIPIDQISAVENMGDVDLYTATSFQTSFVVFNTTKEPFTDPDVRRALNYAVDTEGITQNTVGDFGTEATSMLPEDMAGHVTPDDLEYDGFPYDPEMAESMLDEAGYTGSPRFETTLLSPEDTVRQNPALIIQENLAQIDVNINIREVSTSEYVESFWGETDMSEREPMQMGLWASDFPSPDGILTPLFQSNQRPPGNNWFAYENEEVDEIINSFTTSLDEDERADLMKEANRIIVDEAPGIWLFHPDTTKAFNQSLEGYDGQVPAYVTYYTTFLRDMHMSD